MAVTAAVLHKNKKSIRHMKTDSDIGQDIVNAILERPYPFTLDNGERLYLYPRTLGKVLLVSELLKHAGINEGNIRTNPYGEALRICEKHKELACRIIAIHAVGGKDQMFNEAIMAGIVKTCVNLSTSDLAKLLLLVLSDNDVERFSKHFGIDKEREWQEKAMRAKKDGSTLMFGGKSIYGTLIDNACQRYGWSFEYVVWGISYTNLRMLMADAVSTVFLTDEERKRVRIPNDRNVIDMDDPRNKDIIKQMHWD